MTDTKLGQVILENADATLYDTGDGVALFDIHSRGNSMTQGFVELFTAALDKVEEDEKLLGMVVSNQGKNFLTGGDLRNFLVLIESNNLEGMRDYIVAGQKQMLRMKYFSKPVVATPFGMVLGGGCEFSLHANKLIATNSVSLGLVEPSLGLIPCAGGTKEMAVRAHKKTANSPIDELILQVKVNFQSIVQCVISADAQHAKALDFIQGKDVIVNDDTDLVTLAKNTVLQMVESGFTAKNKELVRVSGKLGLGTLLHLIKSFFDGNYISEHDALVYKKLAFVITGGDVPGGTMLSEEVLLELEVEAFLELCKTEKTLARIKHLLETRKPLRN